MPKSGGDTLVLMISEKAAKITVNHQTTYLPINSDIEARTDLPLKEIQNTNLKESLEIASLLS